MGQGKNSLTGESKLWEQAKQNREFLHYLPLADRRLDIFLERRASVCVMFSLEDKHHYHKHCPFSSSFPQLLMLSMRSYGMGYLFGQMGSPVLAVSIPNSPRLLAE